MERSKVSIIIVAIAVLLGGGVLIFSLMPPLMSPLPAPPAGQWGGWGIFVIIMTLFIGIAYFLFTTSRSSSTISTRYSSAEEILKNRYAKGEITDEEFERMLEKIRK